MPTHNTKISDALRESSLVLVDNVRAEYRGRSNPTTCEIEVFFPHRNQIIRIKNSYVDLAIQPHGGLLMALFNCLDEVGICRTVLLYNAMP